MAGVIATARLRASDPSYIGLLIELTAITAVVVGGTPLTGGRVRILGTVAGAVLMQLLRDHARLAQRARLGRPHRRGRHHHRRGLRPAPSRRAR